MWLNWLPAKTADVAERLKLMRELSSVVKCIANGDLSMLGSTAVGIREFASALLRDVRPRLWSDGTIFRDSEPITPLIYMEVSSMLSKGYTYTFQADFPSRFSK